MVEFEVLDDFDWSPNLEVLAAAAHVRPDTQLWSELHELVEQAVAIGRPRAMYRVAYVEQRAAESVTLDTVTFASRVLRVNLENVHRVFAYCCTCGIELDKWAARLPDVLQQSLADTIQLSALRTARRGLVARLEARYRMGRTSSQAPGSLPNWPIQQQKPLFQLLGDTEAQIGVRLTEHCMMIPAKSSSGLLFASEIPFESCQLCPRQDCPGRRMPYDPGLYGRRYGPRSS